MSARVGEETVDVTGDGFRRVFVQAVLDGPVIANGYMTLDAVLSAVIFQMTEDRVAAFHAVPLLSIAHVPVPDGESARFPGEAIGPRFRRIYAASAAVFEAPAFSGVMTQTRSGRPGLLYDAGDVRSRLSGTGRVLGGTVNESGGGPHGGLLTEHRTIVAPSVCWFAVGFPAAIATLLERYAPAIGARRSSGYGRVRSWVVTDLGPSAGPDDLFGVVDMAAMGAAGGRTRVMRPIPVAIAAGLSARTGTGVTGWRRRAHVAAPYSAAPAVSALVPEGLPVIWDAAALRSVAARAV